jgi:hypothetical protein
MAIARVEPLDFFTMDSLKAGWYLTWRLGVWLAPIFAIAMVAGAAVVVTKGGGREGIAGSAPLIALIVFLWWLVTLIASVALTNKIARQWSAKRYGHAPAEGVWWGITWRAALVGIAMGVGISVVQFLFSGTFSLIAHTVSFVLGIAQVVLVLQSYGWAMSIMVAKRLEGFEPDVMGESDDTASLSADPVDPMAPAEAAPVTNVPIEPVARPSAPAEFRAPRPQAQPAPGGAVQCPKCGLYETELGTVIGRYCKICGWRESQR